MTPLLLMALLALLAVATGLRLLHRARRRGDRGWRLLALGLAHVASVVLFYFVLLPPERPGQAGGLHLLTGGAERPDAVSLKPGDRVVALPEAPALPGVERVPDLGTALRRHPAARPLHVHGAGLVARDRDAARGQPLVFEPAPLPAGLVELSAPTRLLRGRRFAVQGRFEGLPGATVELLDPAGARLDQVTVDDAGRFRLAGLAGPSGQVEYRLRWRAAEADTAASPDGAGELALPVQVGDGAALKVLLLSGGASPELKYLRRWALDAGLQLQSQMSLGGGVDVGDPVQALTAARLAELDLLVLDERAWRGLGAGGRASVREASRAGLGVLLRLTADPNDADRRALSDWGFNVQSAELARGVRLPGTAQADLAPTGEDSDGSRATDTAPLLSRRPLQLAAADGRTLLRSGQGETLALWRAEGQGRMAVWALSDSFRLALAGRGSAYGSLWAETFSTLARSRAPAAPALPDLAWAGERGVLCGLPDAARLLDGDGKDIAWLPDPATRESRCAAFWPEQAGWHSLVVEDAAHDFLVRSPDAAPGLHAAAIRDATLALAAQAGGTEPGSAPPLPGPRWPWALAWLLLAAALWWFERARAGRGPAPA